MDLSTIEAAEVLGSLPPDWRIGRIEDIASVGSGGTPSRKNPAYWGGTIPWVTTAQIEFGTITNASEYITEAGLRGSAARILAPGTLLLALYGQGKTRGKVAKLGIPAATNQACASIVPSAQVDGNYLFHFLASRYLALRGASNAGSQENLSGRIVKETPVALPPKAEQAAIATALSDVDALLTKLDQLIAKKRDIKRAMMQQLLTGRTRLGGFRNPWRTVSFGELFEFLSNASNSRAELSAAGDVGYVHYGDIHSHTSPFFDCGRDLSTFIEAVKVKSTPPLRDGDLLMADASEDTGAIGKAVEITGLGGLRVIGGLHTLVLRSRPGLLAQGFAGYVQFMPAVRAALVRAATGVSVYGVSKSTVRAIVTPLPGVEEQSAITQILSDMGAELTAIEARRDKTRQLKQGMMQALLIGRIRLT